MNFSFDFLRLFLLVIHLLSISSCPIPFDIQSKCRCAITETGRVYIYCARKQLTTIPNFNSSNIIFDELVLSGNRITTVRSNAFSGLKLRKLEFQTNPIVSIETNAFTDLANYLEEFLFSTTSLPTNLNGETLKQLLKELPNLKRLHLRSFDLSALFQSENISSINSMRKLTQLALPSCSIKEIDDVQTFVQYFPNIERFDLSENRFEYLNIPLILSLKKLKILILSKNRIRNLNVHPSLSPLASSFRPSNSIVELDLSYNGIETIDEHLFELISSDLEILNLRNNELVSEKHLTFLIHLYQLREFYFDYNRLETINQLFLPLNLKIFSLKNNRLNHINLSILTRLGNLEKLYLSSNKLSQWSSTMNNIFPSLEILELDRNQLTSISSLNAPKLKQLNLDGNQLGKEIDRKIFANLPQLERLQLRDNQIETIDLHAFRQTRLQTIDLTNNSLTEFPFWTNLNETLQILSLRRNEICQLDEKIFKFYPNLNTIELDQNPLHCDCRFDRFRRLLSQTTKKITGQCQTPIEFQNRPFVDLPVESLRCSSETHRQCRFLSPIPTETSTIASTTITTTITTTIVEEIPVETIRIADLTLTKNDDESKLVVQWDLYPTLIDESLNDEFRRNYFKQNEINGFKISSTSPIYQMSELLDVFQRNFTLENVHQGEICLYLLRRINYEKYCKQLQSIPNSLPIEEAKSSIVIDQSTQQTSSSSTWFFTEPTKSIFIGSIFGILFVLILLIFIVLLITRCPYLFRMRKYHQKNDSKSETLLVRPTPNNTNPWSAAYPIQQHFYHSHPQTLRPVSYQPSLSTQCTCRTHYQSSDSSTTSDASSAHAANPNGGHYHIYQEILNDDYNAQNYRTSRPLHIDTNSPPTNSEQCHLCSLSVLV